MKLEFQFRYCYGNSWPVLEFDSRCSDIALTSADISEFKKSVTVSCYTDSIGFNITRLSKQHNDTVMKDGIIVRDQVVHLDSILVDDILLDLNIIKDYCVYTPVYTVGYLDWCKTTNITPPTTICEQSWYFNGAFSLNYQLPFWDWYANTCRQHTVSNFNSQDIETYFGADRSEHNELLTQLKQLIKLHV